MAQDNYADECQTQEPLEWEKRDSHYKQPFISQSKIRAIVWEKTKGRCWYCGKLTNPWEDFCIDHIIPGIDELNNVVPCCHRCNVRKGKNSDDLDLFRQYVASVALKYNEVPPPFYFEVMRLEA